MARPLLRVLGILALSSCIEADVQNAATRIPTANTPSPTGSGGQWLSGTAIGSQAPPFPTASGSSSGQLQPMNANEPLTVTGQFPCLTANSYVIFTDSQSSSATYPVWTCTTSCGSHVAGVGFMVFPTSTTTGTYEILNPPSGYPALAVSNLALSTASTFGSSTFHKIDSPSHVPAVTLTYAAFPGLSLTVTTTTPVPAIQATPISFPMTCGVSGTGGEFISAETTTSLGTIVSSISPIFPTGSASPARLGDPSNVIPGMNSPPYPTALPAPNGPFNTKSSLSNSLPAVNSASMFASYLPTGAVANTSPTAAKPPLDEASALTSFTPSKALSTQAIKSGSIPPYPTPNAQSNQPSGSESPSVPNANPMSIFAYSSSRFMTIPSVFNTLSNQAYGSNSVPPYPIPNSHSSQPSGSFVSASLHASWNPSGVLVQQPSSPNGQVAGLNPTSVSTAPPLNTQSLPVGGTTITSTIAASGTISTPQVVIESFGLTTDVAGDLAWQAPSVGSGTPVLSPPTGLSQSLFHPESTSLITLPTTRSGNSELPALEAPPLTNPIASTETAAFVTFSGTTTPGSIEISTGVSSDSHTHATGGARPHPIFHGHSHFCLLFCPPHLRCDVCGYSLDLLPGRVYPPGSIKPPPGVRPIDITISVDNDGNPIYDENGEPDDEKKSISNPSRDSNSATASQTKPSSSSTSSTPSPSSSSCSTSAIVSDCNVICSSAASSTASCSTSCSATSIGCSAYGRTTTSTASASACEILQPFSSIITGDIPSSYDVISFSPITIGSSTSSGGLATMAIPSTAASTTDYSTSDLSSSLRTASSGTISLTTKPSLGTTHTASASSSTKNTPSTPNTQSTTSSDASSVSAAGSTNCYSGFHGPDNKDYDEKCNGMCQTGTCLAETRSGPTIYYQCVCSPNEVECVLGNYDCVHSTTTAPASNPTKRSYHEIPDELEGITEQHLDGIAAKNIRRAIVSDGKIATRTLVRRTPDPTWDTYGPSGTRYWQEFQARDVNQPDEALCNFDAEYDLRPRMGKLNSATIKILNKIGINSDKDFYSTTVEYPRKDVREGDRTALFINQFGPSSKTIIAADNHRGKPPGQAPDHWSTIAWYLWRRAHLSANPGMNALTADFSSLQYIVRKEIKNPQTAKIIDLAMAGKELGTIEYFYPNNPAQWQDTSNAFWALLGSPNGQGIINLLKGNKRALHSKTIVRIGVFQDPDFVLENGYGGHMWAELQ